VLVVDDNPVNRMVAELTLRRFGIAAVAVADAPSALSLLATRPFDLVLMDCHMPEVDGFEATRRLRATEASSGRARVPVVAFTASDSEEARRECLGAGMDDLLSKPFRPEALEQVLRAWGQASPVTA
jgi:CheY-like chemotaxis protein